MRTHPASAVALASMLLVGAGLGAQEPPRRLSLEEAVRLLRENSPELALARARVREAAGSARQAAAFPNPSLGTTHETLDGPGSDVSETYLTVTQRFEWPGRRGARARAAERARAEARARHRADSLRLVFEVRRAYLEAAAATRRVQLLEEVTAVFRDAAERARVRFTDGDLSRYDRDRIGLERVRYERSLARARVEAEAARRSLGELILPGEGGAPVTEGLPATLPPGPDALPVLDEAVADHPTVRAARSAVEAARAETNLARSLRYPDPAITGGYKRQSDGFDGLFVGISLPVPLLDRRRGAIEASESRVEAARSRLQLTRRSVEAHLRRAAARYRAVRAQGEIAEDRLGGEGRGLLETARVAYGEGEMELLELLDAASARRDAGVLAAELRSEAWIAYYDFLRAAGGAGEPGSDEVSR